MTIISFNSHIHTSCICKCVYYIESCTVYYVHLNLIECLTNSVKQRFTVTFSILGREVAPKLVRTDRMILVTPVSHEVFLR